MNRLSNNREEEVPMAAHVKSEQFTAAVQFEFFGRRILFEIKLPQLSG